MDFSAFFGGCATEKCRKIPPPSSPRAKRAGRDFTQVNARIYRNVLFVGTDNDPTARIKKWRRRYYGNISGDGFEGRKSIQAAFQSSRK